MNTERPPAPPPPFIPSDERLRLDYEWPLQKIQIAVIITFILIMLTLLCGWLRSRFSGTWLKTATTVILFPGSNKLISFVPGLMDQKYSYDLFALWVAFLTYLGAVANNYSSYRFGDNEDRRINLFMDYIFPWGAIAFTLYTNLAVPDILVPVLVMFWMVLLMFRERRDALNYATRSSFGLASSTKVVSDFMIHHQMTDDEDRMRPPFRYLVGVRDARSIFNEDYSDVNDDNNGPTGFTPSRKLLGESNEHQPLLVTLDKIIQKKNDLAELTGNTQAKKLMDTCFSFSLFWMLLAKVGGHDVHIDAFNDLIGCPNWAESDQPDAEVERIFDIIEVEIHFLYQYFYTNYYAIYVKGIKSKLKHLCIVAVFLWLTLPLLLLYRPQDHSVVFVDMNGRVVDQGITRFVIIVVLLVELAHIVLVLASNWSKIIYLCDFVQSNNPSMLTKYAIKYSTRLSCTFGQRIKIAQYSLKKSHGLIPPLMRIGYFIRELNVMDVPNLGQTGVEHITLHLDLKKAFIRFIKKSVETNNRKISNGMTVLAELEADNIMKDYVHALSSHSEVILIWHIATHELQKQNVSEEEKENIRIATDISNYCAYIVVLATKFLPDSGYVAQCVFDRVIKECNGSRKRSILEIASKLEKDIDERFHHHRWKLLADFWTEMLLYLSLSNNFEAIEAHADSLCTGGELITHLWALSNHAGCYRDPDVKPKIKTREDE